MKTFSLRDRISRYLDKDRPPSTGPIDFEIRALGGNTNTIQLNQLPPKTMTVSPQQRIAELNDEIRQLTCELDYYKSLTEDVLLHIMPEVLFHSRGLFSKAQECSTSIEQAYTQRGQFWNS